MAFIRAKRYTTQGKHRRRGFRDISDEPLERARYQLVTSTRVDGKVRQRVLVDLEQHGSLESAMASWAVDLEVSRPMLEKARTNLEALREKYWAARYMPKELQVYGDKRKALKEQRQAAIEEARKSGFSEIDPVPEPERYTRSGLECWYHKAFNRARRLEKNVSTLEDKVARLDRAIEEHHLAFDTAEFDALLAWNRERAEEMRKHWQDMAAIIRKR